MRPTSAKSQTLEYPLPSSTATSSSPSGENNANGGGAEGSDDAEHIALVQAAWNALMAKHSESKTTTSTVLPSVFSTPAGLADREVENGVNLLPEVEVVEENDFRCIAVEINEERFAVDLVATPAKPQPKALELKSTSPPKNWQNGYAGHTSSSALGASIYIECQEASQYDTLTFGRAYEQYIAKTRSMATLSPDEMDEILRPLLTLSEDDRQKNSGKEGRLPTLASSEDCSDDGVSSTSSSSSALSVCQLVSQIAIDSSKANGNKGRITTPVSAGNPPPPQLTNSLF